MSIDRRLPFFNAGKSLYDEFGAKKMNDFVSYVKSLTPIAGKGIKLTKLESGIVIEFSPVIPKESAQRNHYLMGDAFYGSNRVATGGGRTFGPWGGISDPGIRYFGDQPASLPANTTPVSASPDYWNRFYTLNLPTITSPDYPFGIYAEGASVDFIEREVNANIQWNWVPGQEGTTAIKGYDVRNAPDYYQGDVNNNDSDLIYEIGQLYGLVGRQMRFDSFGNLELVGSQYVAARYAMAEEFYTLGSTVYGSRTEGPGGTGGFWGGWRDRNAGTTAQQTDTWNVTRQPQEFITGETTATSALIYTLGTNYYPIRRVAAAATGESDKYYQRKMTFDCRGGLHELGQEELLEISGSGGSSFLPLNIYGAIASGGGMYVSAYNGTFGGNIPNSPGNEVPTITEGGVTVRIDVLPAPKLSVPSGTKLVYLKVNVNTGGYVLNSLYETTTSNDTPANTTGTLYVKIATVSATTGAVTITEPQNVRGSQTYELCGGSVHLYALS